MAIAAKPERPLYEVIRRSAAELGLSAGDYLVRLAALELGMPEYAPQPTKTPGVTAEAHSASDDAVDGNGIPAKRLPRGTRVEPVRFSYVIGKQYKESFERIAARRGISGAVLLEQVIDHLDG